MKIVSWLLLGLLFDAAMVYARTVFVDGSTTFLPKITELKTVNVKLTRSQIQQFAQNATRLKPEQGGFQPLSTTLIPCTNFSSKSVNIQQLARPIFVVGDDQSSLDWLKHYKNVLEKSNALGLVVTAKNIDRLKKIRAVSGNLTLYLAKGNEVKSMWGVPCYPVLISNYLIEH